MSVHGPAALMAILCGVLGSAAAAAAPALSGPTGDLACQSSLSRLIKGGGRSDVPAACWRVGPLSLGMSEADLTHRMGAPVQTSVLPAGPKGGYEARIYAFPAQWRSDLARRPHADIRLRFVEVLLSDGRVVGIGNDPGARMDFPRCGAKGPSPTVGTGGDPADFRPFQSFAGIRVGMSVQRLTQRFGQAPASNRPGDWRSYLPAPIAFDVDPGSRRILGFSIGADERAVTTGADVHIRVRRNPQTCEISGLSFGD